MNSLKLRATILKLKSHKGSLVAAEAHNMRRIHAEFRTSQHIKKELSKNNIELVPLGKDSYLDKVRHVISVAGIDMSRGQNKRADKGLAIEFLFTCSINSNVNHVDLYSACLKWLKKYYPSCPIIHAVIHYDENEPHLHAIMVPIIGGKLPASDLVGYKGVNNERQKDLMNIVGRTFGFTNPELLQGALKKKATQKALAKINNLSPEEFITKMRKPLEQAVYLRPDIFLDDLDITFNDLFKDYLQMGYLTLR